MENYTRFFLPVAFAATLAALGAGPLAAEDAPEAAGGLAANLQKIKWKPGKGLAVESNDGQFELITRVRVQMLATGQKEEGSDEELGLMLRRARLQFIGKAFGEHNKFKAELAFSPRDLRFTTLDATVVPRESPLLTWYLEFDHIRDLTVRVGQYKIPFSRQRVISSGNQELVDRSIANGEFNLDRDIGVDIRSKDLFGLGMLRYYAGIYNGEGRSVFANGDKNLMYLARFEFLPLGLFKDYSEGDLERLEKPGLSIGAAFAYAKDAGGNRVNRGAPADGGTTDQRTAVLDATFKYQGLSLSSEFFWRAGDRNPGGAVDDLGMLIPEEAPRDGTGWFAQAGYLFPTLPLQFAGRYGEVRGSGTSSLSTQHEGGAAVSYYFAGHPLKIQGDLFRLWASDFSDGTTRGRVQLQAAF